MTSPKWTAIKALWDEEYGACLRTDFLDALERDLTAINFPQLSTVLEAVDE